MPVVLVTGTSTGIGQATALLLARQGFDVQPGLRTLAAGAELLKSAAAESLSVAPVILDVNDDASVRQGVRGILDGAGDIDVLVNNAGMGGGGDGGGGGSASSSSTPGGAAAAPSKTCHSISRGDSSRRITSERSERS